MAGIKRHPKLGNAWIVAAVGAMGALLLGASDGLGGRVVAAYREDQSTSPVMLCCSAEGICLPSDTPGCPASPSAAPRPSEADGLRLTRPRGASVSQEDRTPQEGDPLGDFLAYLL